MPCVISSIRENDDDAARLTTAAAAAGPAAPTDMTSALAEAVSRTNVTEDIISTNGTDNGTTTGGEGGCGDGLNLTCPEDLGGNSIA